MYFGETHGDGSRLQVQPADGIRRPSPANGQFLQCNAAKCRERDPDFVLMAITSFHARENISPCNS